jgi:glutamate-ammonia-ligase adenylyltransferase
MQNDNIQNLIENLPEPESTQRFYEQLCEKSPSEIKKLSKNKALLSDILTLASFSPLLATTILHDPKYISWLKRERISSSVVAKEEILESLARFALTNSTLENALLLAQFRRRELLRIYLRDIRGLGTIAEITEEISNLADAILEYALQIARQELNNRYGVPLETDEKNRSKQAEFCIVGLGKLGSKELNYASDIDLLFLYSNEGMTSGQGTRGAVTNREYFVKLAEFVRKLVGGNLGEGGAYRVDLRLRPNGRIGALAISLKEAVNYYTNDARSWERQVLIRSRTCAGDAEIFKDFFKQVESNVFSKDETVENALRNVRLSKEQINFEKTSDKGFDVKLGKGGIREIEFIAQALQLGKGGSDEWLRASHTLISLSRLADRKLLSESELTQLFDAYDFLRRLEHRLQMKNGLQTHLVPFDLEKRLPIAQKMGFYFLADFQDALEEHTGNVSKIFRRIFGDETAEPQMHTEEISYQLVEIDSDKTFSESEDEFQKIKTEISESKGFTQIISSLEKSKIKLGLDKEKINSLKTFCETTPNFAELLAANPKLIKNLPTQKSVFQKRNYKEFLLTAIKNEETFAHKLAVLRKNWSRCLLEIAGFDIFSKISIIEAKDLQTELAESSIETAIEIAKTELEKNFEIKINEFPFAVLGLGKLGGKGMDYGSDLDLILIYDDQKPCPVNDLTHAEFYSRAVEIFVNTLSSMTREGSLYRVDLRLRPDGKNGATSSGKSSFLSYLETRSAIWEWLAYVKIRGVAGDLELADSTAIDARNIIHQNALLTDNKDLSKETLRVRELLEKEKSTARKGKEIDIKFGEGGLLDVYFAVRFLQLRDNVPDSEENRWTIFTLRKLFENNSLSEDDFQNFTNGYKFLSELDHGLRLIIGRSTRLPISSQKALQTISKRMNLNSVKDLHEQLTFHRLNIRSSFEAVLSV